MKEVGAAVFEGVIWGCFKVCLGVYSGLWRWARCGSEGRVFGGLCGNRKGRSMVHDKARALGFCSAVRECFWGCLGLAREVFDVCFLCESARVMNDGECLFL